VFACVCVCVCVRECVRLCFLCVCACACVSFFESNLDIDVVTCVREVCVCARLVCESFNMRACFCLLVCVWKTRGNQRKVKRANVKWQLGFFAKERKRKRKGKRGRKRERVCVHAFRIILQFKFLFRRGGRGEEGFIRQNKTCECHSV